ASAPHGIYALLRKTARRANQDHRSGSSMSSPSAKNIPLNPSGKSALWLRASHPLRGALRTSRTRGGMRWTRMCATDERALSADGEVVWSWRPDAGAKFAAARAAAGDGGKKAGHRGELGVSRKTIAQ